VPISPVFARVAISDTSSAAEARNFRIGHTKGAADGKISVVDGDPAPERLPDGRRVLSVRAIVVVGLALVVAAVVSVVVLLWQFGSAAPEDAVRLDAVRTAATVVLGGGGAAALALAARRQRATELDLVQRERAHAHQVQVSADAKVHQERVAEASEQDADERRVTELYGQAVDQLGSDKTPVRLGGLYALERLAQTHPPHRQMIVNVVCACLRMPQDGTDDDQEIRRTAQDILARHLRPGDHLWPGIDLPLAKAHLVDLDLSSCEVGVVEFTGASFAGDTTFKNVRFAGRARFRGASFEGSAAFRGARFQSAAEFQYARFGAYATFEVARFEVAAEFSWAEFGKAAWFTGAVVERARFHSTRFSGPADFARASFAEPPLFDMARARIDAETDRYTWPAGYVLSPPVTDQDGQLLDTPGVWGYIGPEG
jgi:hypothetical protein